MKKIRVASRESKLAVIQSQMVINSIKNAHKDVEITLITMKTSGDIILDRSLDKVGGKGLFVKELDNALFEDRADLSVHSLKDMPTIIPEELPLIGFSEREDPRDVLILPKGANEFDLSKPLGCSSLRRIVQVQELFENIKVKNIRGNVLTRLEKLDSGEYGALILAAAGIKRLGLEDRVYRYFTTEEIIPSAGQGIIAVQGRKGKDYEYLDSYQCKDSEYAACCERAFVTALEGDCSSPIGAYAIVEENMITLHGLYHDVQTHVNRRGSIRGKISDAQEIAIELARTLKEK